MLSSKNEGFKEIIAFLGDARREALDSIINNEVEEALANERKREIKRATEHFMKRK